MGGWSEEAIKRSVKNRPQDLKLNLKSQGDWEVEWWWLLGGGVVVVVWRWSGGGCGRWSGGGCGRWSGGGCWKVEYGWSCEELYYMMEKKESLIEKCKKSLNRKNEMRMQSKKRWMELEDDGKVGRWMIELEGG